MKTTLDLPDELVREVKLRAVLQRRTVKDLVAEILRNGLGMAALATQERLPESSMVEIGEGGLPLIRCTTDSPATRMSIEDLLAIEQVTQQEGDLKRAGLTL